ncbi:cytosolic phospholipase A2 gamma isoform X2 [Bombina bombina]|uniref:cytosolic phospholipase A2 gamma isoform X2 n=1 Tax=Bombina bombina TaxID=8345 RepID=UPI00235A804D|nr:cytosolic phospholipase A2 gamma isoform X2 [Bombina bombina]
MENSENEHESQSERPCSSADQNVLLQNDLSEGEKSAILARRTKMYDCFKRLDIAEPKNSQKEPVIAILGSGGGLRATIGLLGCLAELCNQDLLDIVTYLCGTSGSTWCMASLYCNDNWSECMEDMEKKVCDNLTITNLNWPKMWEKLMQSSADDIQSLTDFWAYGVVHMMTNEINENKLSSHQKACENGNNPYPIYSAVEKKTELKRTADPGIWFEFTPHRSGFPAYNCFVETSLLGSQFEDGKLMKKVPERDLCYLQDSIQNALKKSSCSNMENQDVPGLSCEDSIQNALRMSSCSNMENQGVPGLSCEDTKHDCRGCRGLHVVLSEDLSKIKNLVKNQRIHHLALAIKGIMEAENEIPLINGEDVDVEALWEVLNNSSELCQVSKLLYQALISLARWEWGTTYNFLYQGKGMGSVPDELLNEKYLSLIDAGLVINAAFPLILPPYRKVDLILSFDFSAGDPFMTLKSTVKYCQENKIPFPKIHIEKQEEVNPSRNCYIFEEGEEVPIVMHFPLFNNQNCEGNVQEVKAKYPTRKLAYTESEIEELLQFSKMNVKLSREDILRKLKHITEGI